MLKHYLKCSGVIGILRYRFLIFSNDTQYFLSYLLFDLCAEILSVETEAVKK